MSVIRAGIYKMLARIANKEDPDQKTNNTYPDQTASEEAV